MGNPLPGDRAALKRITEKFPLAVMHDVTPFIDIMRNIKTPQEIQVIRRNGKLSADGICSGMAHAIPASSSTRSSRSQLCFPHEWRTRHCLSRHCRCGRQRNTWHYFSDRAMTKSE